MWKWEKAGSGWQEGCSLSLRRRGCPHTRNSSLVTKVSHEEKGIFLACAGRQDHSDNHLFLLLRFCTQSTASWARAPPGLHHHGRPSRQQLPSICRCLALRNTLAIFPGSVPMATSWYPTLVDPKGRMKLDPQPSAPVTGSTEVKCA